MPRAMLGEPSCVNVPVERSRPAAFDRASAAGGWDPSLGGQTWNEFIWAMTRECLDDIAALRTHRVPARHELWRAARHSEERLLAQMDAVLIGGRPVLARVSEWALDAAAPDPDRLFAGVLVFGCVEEPWAPVTAVDLLCAAAARDESGEGEELTGGVEALCLAPHQGIADAIQALLHDDRPLLRAAAVTVLAYRNELTAIKLLGALADEDPRVLVAAATAAGLSGAPGIAGPLAALTEHSDEGVVRAALDGCLLAGVEPGHEAARRICLEGRPEFAQAVTRVALAGRIEDWQVLEQTLSERPCAAAIDAVGLSGHITLIPALLRCLGESEESLRPVVAAALLRLVGSGPVDTITVSRHDPEDEPFLDRIPEPEERQVPSVDPAKWTDWWRKESGRFPPQKRFRRGRLFGPAELLEELDSGPGDPASRRRAHLELSLYVKGSITPRLDPLDFVPRQERALAAIGAWVQTQPAGRLDGRWLG